MQQITASIHKSAEHDYLDKDHRAVTTQRSSEHTDHNIAQCNVIDAKDRVNIHDIPAITEQIWDACVVGAGPAGGAAAVVLASHGAKVLVLDRSHFPRDKPCGCCIHADGVNTLVDLNIQTDPGQVRTVNHVTFVTRDGSSNITVPPVVVLSRSTLDSTIVRRATAIGAYVVFDCSVKHYREQSRRCMQVHAKVNERSITFRARKIIDASGLAPRSQPTRGGSHIGLWAVTRDVELNSCPLDGIVMMIGKHGYVGCVRHADGSYNLAAAVSPSVVSKHGPAGVIAGIASECKQTMFAEHTRTLAWKGTGPLTRVPLWRTLLGTQSTRENGTNNVILAGDRNGFVEPITGEGISWALASGQAAGLRTAYSLGLRECIGSAEIKDNNITSRQRVCAATSILLRSPLAHRVCTKLMQAFPRAATAIVNGCMGRAVRLQEGR